MKPITLTLAVSLLAVSLLSDVALAHQPDTDGTHQQHKTQQYAKHQPMQRMLASLDLTDSQHAQINQLMQQHRAGQDMRRRDNTSRQQMRELMLADSFDEIAARQVLEQQQQQKLERRLAGLKLRHQIMQVLTDEQRQQLADKKQQWQQKKYQRKNS